MAGASLLALIDDIATILDDVAAMTKVAAKKTAGVLGDDLALNARQVSGIRAERELPVVWAVARGSLGNKAILVPLALLISAWASWAVLPLLMIGGAYLCFEGVEKLAHAAGRHGGEDAAALAAALADPSVDMREHEAAKIRGAIRTDFILSAEIIVIALGTVAEAPFATRVLVLLGVALAMTVGVYGLVAAIVKLDDLGLRLTRGGGRVAGALGRAILRGAPWLMRGLSIAGTAAMFLVGGGILVHGIGPLHHGVEALAAWLGALPGAGAVLRWLVPLVADGLVGVLAGAAILLVVTLLARRWPR